MEEKDPLSWRKMATIIIAYSDVYFLIFALSLARFFSENDLFIFLERVTTYTRLRISRRSTCLRMFDSSPAER